MAPEQPGRGPLDYEAPRLSLLVTLKDRPGALADALACFQQHRINLTHIESRPARAGTFDFFLDCEGSALDTGVRTLIAELGRTAEEVLILDSREVPWFPRSREDLPRVASNILMAGAELSADHPGFADEGYRQRRIAIANLSTAAGNDIPSLEYTPDEHATWQAIYRELREQHDQFGCRAFREAIGALERDGLYLPDRIPDVRAVSRHLSNATGFRIVPVTGLLSSRDFLSGLAFRVFFSTQYIRHPSRPDYTPEPDICHELIGHVPMFLDPAFASLSQEIGLASLGAADEDITRLARCYWFSVEFGLVIEDGDRKAYGAGLLSSSGEMAWACSGKASQYLPWAPADAASREFPITTYQDTYYVADSLASARDLMREFAVALPRPFYARHNPVSDTIWVDRAVHRTGT